MRNKKIFEAFNGFKASEKKKLIAALKVVSEKEITLRKLHDLYLSKGTSTKTKDLILCLLLKIKNQKSTSIFLKIFDDPNRVSSFFPIAIWFLSSTPSKKALDFMIQFVKSSNDNERRERAAYILRAYDDNEIAINSMVKVLNNLRDNPKVRGQAAETLGVIGNNSLTKVLTRNLQDDSSDVQFWCIYALWQLCMDTSVIPKLEKFIGNKTIIDNIFIMEEEAKAAIRYIRTRGKVLKRLGITDKSKKTYWKIHNEVQKEVERIEKETGEFYKDMDYLRKNNLIT